jgi:HD-like signal output (HDOD) protein/DNA-binding CsgD family transcriptional regulator
MQATVAANTPNADTETHGHIDRRRLPAPGTVAGRRRQGESHGRRLTLAFEALDRLPVLVESRDRLLSVTATEHVVASEVVAAVESDVALVIAVLRLANSGPSARGSVDTALSGIESLSPEALRALASRASTFDFLDSADAWNQAPARFRVHAVAAQRAADRLATEVGYKHRDRLAVTSLLHDIGKLVMLSVYPGYPARIHKGAGTPEERLHRERRELGVDHALVGGVLIRRWRLPSTIALAIERHHSPDVEGEAAFVQLADMLVHYERGARVCPIAMRRCAYAVGLDPEGLRRVMYEMPGGSPGRERQVDPCPLSSRELSVLHGLARGGVYKQIGEELDLSTSTVRSHLHNIYGKLGAVDRAQAVLTATARGWI